MSPNWGKDEVSIKQFSKTTNFYFAWTRKQTFFGLCTPSAADEKLKTKKKAQEKVTYFVVWKFVFRRRNKFIYNDINKSNF